MAQVVPLAVPTLVLHGGADGVNAPQTSEGRERYFLGRYERKVLPGVGLFPRREQAQQVAAERIRFLCE